MRACSHCSRYRPGGLCSQEANSIIASSRVVMLACACGGAFRRGAARAPFQLSLRRVRCFGLFGSTALHRTPGHSSDLCLHRPSLRPGWSCAETQHDEPRMSHRDSGAVGVKYATRCGTSLPGQWSEGDRQPCASPSLAAWPVPQVKYPLQSSSLFALALVMSACTAPPMQPDTAPSLAAAPAPQIVVTAPPPTPAAPGAAVPPSAPASVPAVTAPDNTAPAVPPEAADPLRPETRVDFNDPATRIDLWSRLRSNYTVPALS